MRKLLAFFVTKRHWVVFILLEVISFTLIFRNNSYQRNMFLSSANVVTGSVLSISNKVFSYFDLQNVNRELFERNRVLEMEVLQLRDKIEALSLDTLSFGQVFLSDNKALQDSVAQNADTSSFIYEYITAGVVNNSITYENNYITINKGSTDGIKVDMGVVSSQGVAGIVMTVRPHYSVVISVLNKKLNINCKVKNTNYFGALSWRTSNPEYAYLEDLPTHATFQIGDTIVTSGYSTVFPPGIMVGVVDSYDKQHDDNFFSLKVRLATNFQKLQALCVIKNNAQEERWEAEKEAGRND